MSLLVAILVLANLLISYKGFKSESFFNEWVFSIERIRIHKEYKRLFTSAFIHINWSHLLFNLFTLYAFGSGLELSMGILFFAGVYFVSLVAGDLLALFVHRNDNGYRSAGASGAISGVVFSTIALVPGMSLNVFFIPIDIPAWIYGTFYILYTIYGVRSRIGNIGHDAHLGGAVAGMLFTIAWVPDLLQTHLFPILLMLVPSLAFIILLINKPEILVIGIRPKKKAYHNIDEKYNMERKARQEEIDNILDKIAEHGVDSLTAREKKMLDDYSRDGKS